jgi:ATP-dependent DNA helicase RecQ
VPSSEALLHELFGFPSFRPGQQRAVEAALEGRDALVVMPTGAGKSLCYSIPGLAGPDLTIVVSPLQALMRDQVEALRARGHETAFRLDSSLGAQEALATLSAVADGTCRLVFVAPERFADARFRGALQGRPVDLFAVDEAHCLSDWGHDFRPDYLRLADARDEVAARCTMALTATATHRVALDIARAMRLHDPVDVATGFDRPNLTFDVIPARTEAAKWRLLRAGLADAETRPALVYAGTRRRCEELASQLRAEGVNAAAYHAGLPDAERAAVQTGFMQGDPEVVVATTAFGMGVDKADVRAVWHWALPDSLEAYYQEAGRAGRDGQPARCVLLYAASDRGLIGRRIAERAVDAADVNGILRQLTGMAGEDGVFGVSLDGLGERGKTLLAVAERIGALELWPGRGGQAAGRLRLRAIGRGRSDEVENASRSALRIRWEALAAITAYARRVAVAGCSCCATSATRPTPIRRCVAATSTSRLPTCSRRAPPTRRRCARSRSRAPRSRAPRSAARGSTRSCAAARVPGSRIRTIRCWAEPRTCCRPTCSRRSRLQSRRASSRAAGVRAPCSASPVRRSPPPRRRCSTSPGRSPRCCVRGVRSAPTASPPTRC